MPSPRRLSWLAAFPLIVLVWSAQREPAGAQVITSGPKSCQAVAITFDLCPVRTSPGYDADLIADLKGHRTPATFFMSGRWIARHGEQVHDLRTVPYFELGTHGQVHDHLPLLSKDQQRTEIQQAVALLHDQYHLDTTLFRPPYGEYNQVTEAVVAGLGLKFILWNVVSGDPSPVLTAEDMKTQLQARVRNGSIIVFHANGKGKHTREAVEYLTQEVLPTKHLTALTVSDLLRCATPSTQEHSRP